MKWLNTLETIYQAVAEETEPTRRRDLLAQAHLIFSRIQNQEGGA